MIRFLPAPLFRAIAPIAHRVRHHWRLARRVPLVGVTMIVRDFSDRVLLVRHSYGPEGWFLPGGGVGSKENPERAAVRELAEETGCLARGVRLVGTLEEAVSGSPHTAHIFTCTTEDVPRTDRREIIEARFFPLHSLPEPMGQRTRERLALFTAGRS